MKTDPVFPNFDNSNPVTCISAKMMKCNRIVANTFRKHLKAFNITSSQLSMLFILAKKKGLNQKTLSQLLFMDKSTVNRNLKRLIESEYVSKEDYSLMVISNTGMELLERIIPHWENAMEEVKEILGVEGEESLDLLTTKLLYQNGQ